MGSSARTEHQDRRERYVRGSIGVAGKEIMRRLRKSLQRGGKRIAAFLEHPDPDRS